MAFLQDANTVVQTQQKPDQEIHICLQCVRVCVFSGMAAHYSPSDWVDGGTDIIEPRASFTKRPDTNEIKREDVRSQRPELFSALLSRLCLNSAGIYGRSRQVMCSGIRRKADWIDI